MRLRATQQAPSYKPTPKPETTQNTLVCLTNTNQCSQKKEYTEPVQAWASEVVLAALP